MELPAELQARIDETITQYPVSKRSAILPLLHLIQEHFGYIEDEAVLWIAMKLDVQPINVLELVTFYPMFRRQPAGKHHIRVCRTLSCAMTGGYQLLVDNGKTFIAPGSDLQTSKEWLTILASEFLKGRSFEVPGFVRSFL